MPVHIAIKTVGLRLQPGQRDHSFIFITGETDENGEWDTHYGVYGSAFKGGLAGGGSVLGHMAEVLDPIWPQSIRDYLPRWWTDRALRRQQALAR